MANWWDNAPVVDETQNAPAEGDNWWEAAPTVDQTDEDSIVAPSPDGGLMDDLNRMREGGELDKVPTETGPDLGTLRSQSELYGGLNEKEKYAPVVESENSWGSRAGNVKIELPEWMGGDPNTRSGIEGEYTVGSVLGGLNPLGDSFGTFQLPDEVQDLKKLRAEEAMKIYEQTGQADTVAGIIPVRTQERMTNNPNFDPTKEPGPNNEPMQSTRYVVDKPTQDVIGRMAYQVMKNIVGGTADLAQGKISEEGTVGKAIPGTVPDQIGEKFVEDMTTYAIGGAAATGAGAKAIGKIAQSVGGIIPKTVGLLSPAAREGIYKTYDAVLKRTGDAVLAQKAARAYTSNTLVGLGLRGTTVMATEAAVAPNDAEGILPPDAFVGLGASKEWSADMAQMADTPIVGGILGTFGKIANSINTGLVQPSIGGLRNAEVFGMSVGKVLKTSDKIAGMKLAQAIDPNLKNLAPEDAAFKIKVLGDAISRNAEMELKIAGAGGKVKVDTATAYNEAAEDYFRIAYANRKDVMGEEAFNKWVQEQARDTSTVLYEIRTSLNTHDTAAKGATTINDTLDEAKDVVAGGNLAEAQEQTGRLASDSLLAKRLQADTMENAAKTEATAAKEAAERGVSNDPEFKLFMEEANAELGSKSGVYDVVHGNMSEKTYQSLKKLKTDTDNAYRALADTGAQGDANSILEVIKKYSDVTPGKKPSVDSEEALMREKLGLPIDEAGEDVVKITDPFLRKIANEVNADDSFGNIYNNIRNQVNKEISRANAAKDSTRLDALYELRDNINNEQLDFVAAQGDEGIKRMVADAKEKYINYKSTFGEPENKALQKAGEGRLTGEKFVPGKTAEGQGKTNWDVTFGNKIQELDGVNGKPLRESLKRAAAAGGNDISGDLANYYATRAITNLANSASSGAKQGVGELRRNISGIVEGLQGVNSPLIDKFKALEVKLQTLENTAVDKAAAYESIKAEADAIRKEASQSILAKFVYGDGTPLKPSEVGSQLRTMFRSNTSTSQIDDLIKRADSMGEDGQAIKDALKGTYMDYVRERIGSRSALGIGEPTANGKVRTGFRINETQADKLFDEGGKDMANMRAIFRDQPEVIDGLEEMQRVYTSLSKKTPHQGSSGLEQLSRNEDPAHAIQSGITLLFGVLNPVSSKARRLTMGYSAQSLGQVAATRKALLDAMMEDPVKFGEIMKTVKKGVDTSEARKYFTKYLVRSYSLANTDALYGKLREGEDQSNASYLKDEMKKLK